MCAGGGGELPQPPASSFLPLVSLVDDGFLFCFGLGCVFIFFLALQVERSTGAAGVGACHFTVTGGYGRREKGRASGSHSQGLADTISLINLHLFWFLLLFFFFLTGNRTIAMWVHQQRATSKKGEQKKKGGEEEKGALVCPSLLLQHFFFPVSNLPFT